MSFLSKTFIASAIAILLSLLLETPFGILLKPTENFYGALITAALIAPIVEETVKALSVIYIAKRIHPDAGFFTGLFFGIIETIMYAFSYSKTIVEASVLVTVRLAVSVPLHAACTAMFLYGLYLRKKNRDTRITRIASAYLIHGLFNFSNVAA